MKKFLKNKFLVLITLMAISCGPVDSGNQAYQALSSSDKDKFRKYLLLGQEIYADKCASCHMADGKGLRGVIPPLAQADYLVSNQPSIPCLLRKATKDTVIVNGRSYPPEMPAHDLTNLELAEVITYINNSWGNEIGFMSVKKVDSLMRLCN